jgi:hypothetical protein
VYSAPVKPPRAAGGLATTEGINENTGHAFEVDNSMNNPYNERRFSEGFKPEDTPESVYGSDLQEIPTGGFHRRLGSLPKIPKGGGEHEYLELKGESEAGTEGVEGGRTSTAAREPLSPQEVEQGTHMIDDVLDSSMLEDFLDQHLASKGISAESRKALINAGKRDLKNVFQKFEEKFPNLGVIARKTGGWTAGLMKQTIPLVGMVLLQMFLPRLLGGGGGTGGGTAGGGNITIDNADDTGSGGGGDGGTNIYNTIPSTATSDNSKKSLATDTAPIGTATGSGMKRKASHSYGSKSMKRYSGRYRQH